MSDMSDTPEEKQEEKQEEQPRKRRGADPRLTTGVAIFLLLGALYILMRAQEKPQAPPAAPALTPAAQAKFEPVANGTDAADFTLKTLDGNHITFSKFRDGKYAIVVFYTPCGSG